MNPVEQILKDDLDRLVDRLAASVPGHCLETIAARHPTLRARLDEVEGHMAGIRRALLDDYGRWRRALEDMENLWALAAWRSAAEEPAQPAGSLAA